MTETVITSAMVAMFTAVMVTLCVLWVIRDRKREAPQAYLYRRKGKRVVKYELCDDVCRIGRHHDNEIQLNDNSVSRFHAQVVNNRNGSFMIRDLDSKNGVKVFFRHVTSAILHDGDVVYVGNVPMKFMRYPMDYKTVPDTVMMEDDQGQRFKKRQRHIERFKVNKAVRFYIENIGWHIGRVTNISEEGLFIRTNQKVQLRTPIDIILHEENQKAWLKMTGEVTRQEKGGIGVVFTDVDRETKAKLYQIGKFGTETASQASTVPTETIESLDSYLDTVSKEL